MPYEYRKMTPEQREETVHQRQTRGYPWHQPPHPFRDSGYYLLSAANFEHIPIITPLDRRTEFESRLLTAMSDIKAEVFAWVVLPNHYHIVVNVASLDLVSATFKQLHGTTSHEWNLADHQTGKRRVWYRFNDRVLRDNAGFYRALNYVHYNPVKHGYTDDPYDWPWSSLSNYADSYGREWLREKWKAHRPPDDYGIGWDD